MRWPRRFALLVLAALGAGCVGAGVGVGGVGYDADVDVGGDYYGPPAVVYGGWAPNFWVGPGHPGPWHAPPGRPAYRPAPPSHRVPSIPSRHRR